MQYDPRLGWTHRPGAVDEDLFGPGIGVRRYPSLRGLLPDSRLDRISYELDDPQKSESLAEALVMALNERSLSRYETDTRHRLVPDLAGVARAGIEDAL